MTTYAIFTSSYGTNHANLPVKITEVSTGIPALIMVSSTGGVISKQGDAVLDSSGNLSVYLDNSKTFAVRGDAFVLPSPVVSGPSTFSAISDMNTYDLGSNNPSVAAIKATANAAAPLGSLATINTNVASNTSSITTLNTNVASNTTSIAGKVATSSVGVTGGVAPNGDTVQITANVVISVANSNAATYNGKTLEFTGTFSVTVGAGLTANFGFAYLPPTSGTATIVSDGTTTFNGATTTISRAAGSVVIGCVVQRNSNQNQYAVV